ncbi:recombinase family protein [Modestobacter altitudinis]|uniref:recombinase family protein n=1 Tax=Modestobacter altitudinis TaxID=2213158 RepID=UPI00110CCCFE
MVPPLTHLPPNAIGYCRVSTGDQVNSGAGLDAQRAALQAEADRRGWNLEFVIEDGLSAKDLNRPALVAALGRMDRGEADVLMVSKLDRLSRSVKDFGGLLERASRRNWSVLCLDLGVDTTTPVGEFTANVVVSASQYERRLIGQRTKDALAAKKAAGVKLGRPRLLPADLVKRIVEAKEVGGSLAGIARDLTSEGVPTAQGGKRWYASTVAAVLRSAERAK